MGRRRGVPVAYRYPLSIPYRYPVMLRLVNVGGGGGGEGRPGPSPRQRQWQKRLKTIPLAAPMPKKHKNDTPRSYIDTPPHVGARRDTQ